MTSTDGGPKPPPAAVWELLPSDPSFSEELLTDMEAAGQDLYLVAGAGLVLRSTDEGETWSNVGVPPSGISNAFPKFSSVAASAADDVWVGGTLRLWRDAISRPGDGILIHSSDGGRSWQPFSLGDAYAVQAVRALDRENVLVSTAAGEVWRTTDGGASWTRVFFDPATMPLAFWASSPDDVCAVGGIYRDGSTDGGSPSPDAGADGGAAAPDAALRPSSGLILHSSDRGATWRTVFDGGFCPLLHVSGTPDGTIVYGGSYCGTVLQTTDRGASWSVLSSGIRPTGASFTHTLYGLWVSSAGETYFAVDDKVCRSFSRESSFSSTSGCESLPWRQYDGGGSVWASPMGLWGMADGTLWAYARTSFLWRRTVSNPMR